MADLRVARITRPASWPKGVCGHRVVHVVEVEGETFVARCGERWATTDDSEIMSPAYRGAVCEACA